MISTAPPTTLAGGRNEDLSVASSGESAGSSGAAPRARLAWGVAALVVCALVVAAHGRFAAVDGRPPVDLNRCYQAVPELYSLLEGPSDLPTAIARAARLGTGAYDLVLAGTMRLAGRSVHVMHGFNLLWVATVLGCGWLTARRLFGAPAGLGAVVVLANAAGVVGRDAGRSVTQYRQKYEPQYRIYLQPPDVATYNHATPDASNFDVSHDNSTCNGVAPGFAAATFTFESSSGGTWHIVCDIDGNGEFDLSTNIDAARSGEAVIGTNEARWYGRDNDGEPLPPGNYACELTLTSGEVHFIADDIETAYPGIRTFEVRRDEGRSPQTMYWNDYDIQENAVEMPDGRYSPVSSGFEGIDPGSYDTMPGSGVNTHAWGNWGEAGKGDYAFIDTFTWLESVTVGSVDVNVVDVETDIDNDGTPDACQLNYYRGGCQSAPMGSLGLLASLAGLLALTPSRRRKRT